MFQCMWCVVSGDPGPATRERGIGRDSDSVCISSEWLCSSVCGVLCQVIRGLRQGRGGLVVTQRQFEFLHQVLEEMLWGRGGEGGEGGGEEMEETDGGGRTKNKKKKNKKAKGLYVQLYIAVLCSIAIPSMYNHMCHRIYYI